jgi:hypothetical protein
MPEEIGRMAGLQNEGELDESPLQTGFDWSRGVLEAECET